MLILNTDKKNNHLSIIKKIIDDSSECYFLVAFLKNSGLSQIINNIITSLESKLNINLIIGLDLLVTEPAALYRLLDIQYKYDKLLKIHLFKSHKSTFHPKIYAGKSTKTKQTLIGSANITGGGLDSNNEASIYTQDTNTFDDAIEYFNKIISDGNCKDASYFSIAEYEEEYNEYNKLTKEARKKAKSNFKPTSRDARLLKLYEEYRENSEQAKDLAKKRNNYKKASSILNKITHKKILDKNIFFAEYEKLVGAEGIPQLWHSGGINRSKSAVKEYFYEFIDLNEHLLNPNNIDLPVDKVFENSLPYVKKINGLAFNVLTEMLNTLKPEKFPVLNRNPLGSIRYLFGDKFKSPSSFKPSDYLMYTKFMASIKNTVNAKDFTEVDHFLNYVYWNYAKK